MTSIQPYENGLAAGQIEHIREQMMARHAQIGQLNRPTPERTLTARNYDSSIRALGDYLQASGEVVPTKRVLEQWRDEMRDGRILSPRGKPYATKTINARLSAIRKLLNGVADDVTDIQIKLVLRDWATVDDAKEIIKQDMTEADYGRRLTLDALGALVNAPDTSTIKGIRDRAIIALMGGAGLRVSEVVRLTLADALHTESQDGQRAILVRHGKHNKQRQVMLNSWNSWVIQAVEAYTNALGLIDPDALIFRGVNRVPGGHQDNCKPLSKRGAIRAVQAYAAQHNSERVTIASHDLRRTYAKLCKDNGMSWEALRANMGHASVVITERYVGHDVDSTERVPNWTIKLD